MLELKALCAAPAGAPADVLKGIDLRVAAGEQLALIGPSGAGKTSLLQVLAAALKPRSGSLAIAAQAPWRLSAADLRALRAQIFLAPQTPPLPPRQRVVTAVLAARLPAWGLLRSLRSLMAPVDLAEVQAALARFDLAGKLFERVDRLSGGERQRVALARAWLSPARLWLVDEPLSALDPQRAVQALQALIDEAQARRVTLIASLHHVELALAHFPRIVGLREGQVLFDLPAAEVSPAHLRELYAQHEDELLATPPVPNQAEPVASIVYPCR
ncbi:phosphonate ABC transporter [Paucibacter sp. KBW04]|uniref:phosphonate ABC transporter ATP-binding protein n=1 Tax=Paucibacter sp. KBW04 TaxID=2153361 RepID=UPI000F58E8D1|nr:ATP-binding cassette domain-containing protein [Paucibacter sp. KBW04]RQO63551.1 phosphonate ABC transporter [Paucibacter sp. KBW04]